MKVRWASEIDGLENCRSLKYARISDEGEDIVYDKVTDANEEYINATWEQNQMMKWLATVEPR